MDEGYMEQVSPRWRHKDRATVFEATALPKLFLISTEPNDRVQYVTQGFVSGQRWGYPSNLAGCQVEGIRSRMVSHAELFSGDDE